MFIVLDLETTGLDVKQDEIIEIACIKIDRQTFKEVDRLSTFIKPKGNIPELISQITNIFDRDVINAPRFIDIEDKVQDFIEGYPIIGHNIPFDIRFLESHGIDTSKNPYIDTFFLANFLCFQEKSLNLGYLCEVFNIPLENAHRAIDDTLATAELFKCLIQKLASYSGIEEELIYHYFNNCNNVGVRILKDEYLKKIDTNEEKIIEKYLNSLLSNIGDKSDKGEKLRIKNPYDVISKIPGFELRENQKKMLDRVDKTLSQGEKVIIEAPTGIGKTFAYLIPAIKHSLEFGEPVHISTSTKALQDQIYYKDLHFLQESFSGNFSFTKLKGKRNYLGISSFIEFIENKSTDNYPQRISFILKIFIWSLITEFGELDELDFYGEEYSYLPEIHAGSSFIFHESNIYKDYEFALRARNKAKNSDIIITNNHILFQDIISEGSLLGGVKNLILDEAHSLEDIVTQSLKKSLSYQSIERILKRIESRALKKEIIFESFSGKRQELLFDSAEVFSILEGEIFSKFRSEDKYKSLLLDEAFFSSHEDITHLSHKLIKNFEVIRQEIFSLGEKKALLFSQETQEILYIQEIIKEVFIAPDIQKNIYYVNYFDQSGTSINYTVLHPGEFLRDSLWSSLESTILTSATLRLQDDYAYIMNVLKLDGFTSFTLPSDFNYDKQALVFIPQDLGDIRKNLSEIIEFLEKFILTVKGNTLVLFTAFFAIREVFSRLKISLEREGVNLLAQSISGSKHKQIDYFKKNPQNSILLGTDTFWEGIDIPGEDLRYLLIHKIPFSVPSDPIFMARSKLFQDSFKEYAIPKAILKLKQGFGRLIRTKTDTGIVVFLDNRIYQSSWGETFLSAFPKDVKIRYGSSEKLLSLLSDSE